MTLLIMGNILWIIAHSFKRLLPNFRNALGNAGKGAVALSLIIALVLIITGYRSADYIAVWAPPYFLVHINNVLMILAVFVFAVGHTKGRLRGPQSCETAVQDKLHSEKAQTSIFDDFGTMFGRFLSEF